MIRASEQLRGPIGNYCTKDEVLVLQARRLQGHPFTIATYLWMLLECWQGQSDWRTFIYPPYWSHDRYLVKREQQICKLAAHHSSEETAQTRQLHDHFLLIMTSRYGSTSRDTEFLRVTKRVIASVHVTW